MNRLEKKIGLSFKNKALLTQALTHTSYANENNAEHNERLEFLGDALIGLLMGEYLYNEGGKTEGEMSKKRAELVREEALDIYAKEINLSKYLLLGKGVLQFDGANNPAIIADAYEALFGAIYLEFGFDKTKEMFYKLIIPHIQAVKITDYKSTLQELVQVDRRNITYYLEKEEGPAHNKTFTVSVRMDSIVLGRGMSKTKKDAEQEAAKEALNKLVKE